MALIHCGLDSLWFGSIMDWLKSREPSARGPSRQRDLLQPSPLWLGFIVVWINCGLDPLWLCIFKYVKGHHDLSTQPKDKGCFKMGTNGETPCSSSLSQTWLAPGPFSLLPSSKCTVTATSVTSAGTSGTSDSFLGASE